MSCCRSKHFATGHPPLPSAAEKTLRRHIVCYVTDGKSLTTGDRTAGVLAQVQKAIAAGADWVQIRERDLPGRDLLSLARRAVGEATASAANVQIILNDRVDVALAAGAAGVHLGGESLPVVEVLRWCRAGNAPANWLVGVSCHSVAEALEAERAGASYIFFGPVFDTPSKRSFGPPQGVAKLGEVCRSVEIRVIAIGGVNEMNGAECLRAGAAGVAAIRLFQQPSATSELKRTIEALHSPSL
jgi:thiamine-phosphate pyrophosphorylase